MYYLLFFSNYVNLQDEDLSDDSDIQEAISRSLRDQTDKE